MRPQFLSFVIATLALLIPGLAAPAQAQSCSGYPAAKTWTAGGTNMIHQIGGGGYPGWALNWQSWADEFYAQNHPVTVDGMTAQQDAILSHESQSGWALDLAYTTENSGWTLNGRDKLSISWQLHVSDPGTHDPSINSEKPRIRLGNGTHGIELAYYENVTGVPGCILSGWRLTEGVITSGGREIPNQLSPAERYLPMAKSQWHTLRADLNTDGTFDVWLDGGGSDWRHVSGTTGSTSSTYIAFGVVGSDFESHEFSTACVAWGEGASQIPSAPSGTEEICDNGNIDDDGDGAADCADVGCDCSFLPVAEVCNMFVDVYETFNDEFVPDPVTGDFSDIPPDWARSTDPGTPENPGGYTMPAFTNKEGDGGTYTLDGGALRWRIAFNDIPNANYGCGTGPFPYPYDCYTGTFTLEQNINAQDMATLPIDWTKPVLVAVDTQGSDLTGWIGGGNSGKWEPFIEFEGYTGTRTSYEWGYDGLPIRSSKLGFIPVTYELDPGQGEAAGTRLLIGVDFDFRAPAYLWSGKTNIAFMENVRIYYYHDATVPVMRLNASAFSHDITCGDPPRADTFTITNTGGSTMSFTVSDDADWLTATPALGAPLATGQSDTVAVSYDLTGLLGTYYATISLASSEAFRSPLTIGVTLTVNMQAPDYDCDGDVDQSDFAVLQRCLTGPGEDPTPGLCADFADLNSDTQVDQQDVLKFEQCATGPGVPFDPDCLTSP